MYQVNVFRDNSQLQNKNYLVGFKFDYFLLLTISHYYSQFRVPPRQWIIKEYLLTEKDVCKYSDQQIHLIFYVIAVQQ